MRGGEAISTSPSSRCRSVRQTPHACTRSSSCPGPGWGIVRCSARSGRPTPSNTIARVVALGVACAIVAAVNHEPAQNVMPALYFSPPACLKHDPRFHPPAHPDTPERLITLESALAQRDWLGWERREAPAAAAAP